MEKQFKISIIVPCYNVDKYIDRCLTSIVNQTIGIEHLEIILINDASKDDTLLKLNEWEQNYPENVLVITYEENMRQGGARNIGLSYASGDLIGFVDSDDWIALDMYEKLYTAIVSGDHDIARCKYVRIDDAGNTGEPGYGSICTCLFARDLVLNHNIFFPEHMAYEDNYWWGLVKLYIKNEILIDDILYYYYVNTNSTVVSKNQTYHLDRLKIELMLMEEIQKRGLRSEDDEELFLNFLQRFYLNSWFIIFTRFDTIPNLWGTMKTSFELFFPDYKERLKNYEFNPASKILIDLLVSDELSPDLIQVKNQWIAAFNQEQL